ncbi:hypothetical protein HA466_0132760 [Hirschfeldia incana]|nr:hypothetical protein HA466_0132760 [Hirschfeldia incana]
MMVAKSFDLWQKDVFFSAAEEVQQSADTMESAYRMWIKERREGARVSVESDHLCNELQAALSTAKWQLEEFERAVRLSHEHCCRDDTTLARHKQFVSAIENHIHRVQSALSENGEQPLRWMDLNKEERDDLAMFLSGSSQTSESLSSSESPDFVIDIDDERGGSPESAGKKLGTRRTWSSPNVPDVSSLRVDVRVDAKEEEKKRYVSDIEGTPKEKGYKPLFWMQRCRDYNQLFDRVRYYQRRFGVPFNRPVRLIVSLTLLLFLLLLFRAY